MPNAVVSILVLICLAMVYLLVEWSPLRRPWRQKHLRETELSPRRVVAGIALASLILFVTLPLAAPIMAAIQAASPS